MQQPAEDLQKKLGIKPGLRAVILNAPVDYDELVPQATPLTNVQDLADKFDWLQAFYTDRQALESEIVALKNSLTLSGQLWLCWPKKSSSLKTNLSDGGVREIGLSSGLVDIKVAAINETWSGLKFVYRLADR